MAKNKKKRSDGPGNTWLATFNDLMTLLLTFFVLLLSMGSLEGGKIKTLITELNAALSVIGSSNYREIPIFIPLVNVLKFGKEYKEVQQIPRTFQEKGDVTSNEIRFSVPPRTEAEDENSNKGDLGENKEIMKGEKSENGDKSPDIPKNEKKKELHPLEDDIERIRMDFEGLDYRVDEEQNLIIELPNTVLFNLGQAEIKTQAVNSLQSITGLIAKYDKYQIVVQGHTDDWPIHTAQFPSNWELSVARASNVAKFLIEGSNVNPNRFMVSGYGDSRPKAPNDSAPNRSLNRRVEIKLIQKN